MMMRKFKSKKGFTLAELLIVIAIIAILVAIAIPIFKTQLDNAKAQVKAANERSASAIAVAAYMTDETAPTDAVDYYFKVDDNKNLEMTGTASDYKIKVTVDDGKVTGVSTK